MYIQLRSIYNILYSTKSNNIPLLRTVRKEDNLEENSFSCFYHPSMIRWSTPALRGKVRILYSEEEEEQIQNGLDLQSPVVNHIDFVRLHFHSVYDQICYEFEPRKSDNKNLKDFMLGPKPTYKGSGAAIRDKLIACFSDPAKIREFVITQWLILNHYEYRPDVFRASLMGIIDDAIKGVNKDNHSSEYRDTLQHTRLLQLRTLVLELLSSGNDATALACVLMAGALGDKPDPAIWNFQNGLYSDCLQLVEDAELCRQELGNGYYLTYFDSSNFVGGRRKSDITLWKHPATMIEKINDRLGYFYYPVEINEQLGIGPSVAGHCVKYISSIEPFRDGKALFTWMYQPDGRYFEDNDGYGGENCEEIMLYAYLNENGRFITPFSLTTEPINSEQ